MAKKLEKHDWAEGRGVPPMPAGGPGGALTSGKRAERLETWALYAVVLVCGAGLMSLEMVGARVLWNNFGSSVFVWGSIISVFMAALSTGYYLGGLLADRRPDLGWLAGIAAAAGALVLAVTYLGVPICNWIDDRNLGPRAGPLVASVALYFAPSVLLGAVSPFAVRLQARALTAMGNVAGRLYALGTVGSLAGTLLTTFVLIPAMGTSRILYVIGLVLVATAVLGLAARFAARGGPRSSAAKAATAGLLVGSFLLGYVFCPNPLPGSLTPPAGVRLYAAGPAENPAEGRRHERGKGPYQYLFDSREYESAYHSIAVVGQYDVERALRARNKKVPEERWLTMRPEEAMRHDPGAVLQMRFNNLIESSLYLNKKGHPPATTYTKILHLGMAMNPGARKVLLVGLGGGSVPREFCEVYEGLRLDVVEIDPAVVEVARKHFFHRDGKGVKTYVDDGRQFARRPGRGRFRKYDLVILDAYSGGGQIPAHLVTREFIEQVRARLAPGSGVLVSNIISALEGPKSRFFRAEYKTVREVFPQVYAFPSRQDRPDSIRNVILVATQRKGQPLLRNDLVARAEAHLERCPGLKERTANPERRGRLESFAENYYPLGESDLADVPVLTDEYAPVETMFWWSTRFER